MQIVATITALVELVKLLKSMFSYFRATFGDDYVKVIRDMNVVFSKPPETSEERKQSAKDIRSLIKRL